MSKRAGSKFCIGVNQSISNRCCGLCSYKTRSLTGLKLHLRERHREKIVMEENKREKVKKCSICGKAFEKVEEVVDHVKRSHRES